MSQHFSATSTIFCLEFAEEGSSLGNGGLSSTDTAIPSCENVDIFPMEKVLV